MCTRKVKEGISIAVRNTAGKVVMECVIETKARMILQFINGLRRDLQVASICPRPVPLFFPLIVRLMAFVAG